MDMNYEIVDCVEKLQEAITRTREAQKKFATYTQEQVGRGTEAHHLQQICF